MKQTKGEDPGRTTKTHRGIEISQRSLCIVVWFTPWLFVGACFGSNLSLSPWEGGTPPPKNIGRSNTGKPRKPSNPKLPRASAAPVKQTSSAAPIINFRMALPSNSVLDLSLRTISLRRRTRPDGTSSVEYPNTALKRFDASKT
jgi:hypothetical protein